MKKIIKMLCFCMVCAVALAGCGSAPQSGANLIPGADSSGIAGSDISGGEQSGGSSSLPQAVQPYTEAEKFKLVIPEGFTLAKVGMRLEELGICTVYEFIEAAQEGDFSEFPLIAGQDDNEMRCYKLEGYLFPATYDFYETASPDEIIRTLLAQMESRINESLRAEIAQSGFTVDQIITLASIIEKEARGPEQMANISSVFHNRLEIGMQIQSDVTISYVVNVIDPFIPDGGETYKYYYNTYRCAALPAGPVCNPGMDAIYAALRPAQTDYLYFLTDEDNNFYFTNNYDEHQANSSKYLGD